MHKWPTTEFFWLPQKLIAKVFPCTKFPGQCTYVTDIQCNLDAHLKSCTNKSKVYSQQKAYGKLDHPLDKVIDNCWLTESFRGYRKKQFSTWDIETLEEDPINFMNDGENEDRQVEGYLKLATIAVASNMEGVEPKYFERKSSKPEDEQELVNRFLDYMLMLGKKYVQEHVPQEIKTAVDNMNEKLKAEWAKRKSQRNWQMIFKLNGFRATLMEYMTLNVYGFNSAKFDLPIILPAIAVYCNEKSIDLTNPLKKTGYMTLSVGNLKFLDIMNYTSPVSLDKYMKQWNAPEAKLCFPHG